MKSHSPRPAPGTAPGTLRIDPNAPPSVVRVMTYGASGAVERELADLGELGPLLDGDDVVWVDVVGLGSEEVLRALGDRFDLHRLALEDVVNVTQRPKVEEFPGHLYVVARVFGLGDDPYWEQLSLFFGEGWVLTLQERPGDYWEPVRKRIRSGRGRIRRLGADYLAYALLDAVVDHYFLLLERHGDRIDALEEALSPAPEADTLTQVHQLKRELITMRHHAWPQREMLGSLLRDESPYIGDETRPYLRDCLDHAVQVLEVLDSNRELVSGLQDLHLAVVSNRMNEVMKVLTIIATIFIPLGFIAGVYGMNFDPERSSFNMPELRWSFGYPMALGLMAAVAAGLVLYFRRKGWL